MKSETTKDIAMKDFMAFVDIGESAVRILVAVDELFEISETMSKKEWALILQLEFSKTELALRRLGRKRT